MVEKTVKRPEKSSSQLVVDAIADFDDTKLSALPALYETIDPDALDSLVKSSSDDLRVEFKHSGYKVVVNEENTVIAMELDN